MRRLIPVPRQLQRRGGTLFHYYLTYLFLTSVLLTTTGLCLHTVLKADRLDNQASAYLKTLLRLESGLRTDETDAVDMETTATELKFHLPEADSTVRWLARENVLTREEYAKDALTASDRFVFRKGTSLEFVSDSETQVRLTLTEPPRLGRPETNPTAAMAQNSRQVEIVLIVRPSVRLDLSVQPVSANESAGGDTATVESEGAN
jgi:hypothetical protein